jgi:hypothetical protein
MKMLFSLSDASEAKLFSKKLSKAGISCKIRKKRLVGEIFRLQLSPELWIKNDGDILKALKRLSLRRLREMTVTFSKPSEPPRV